MVSRFDLCGFGSGLVEKSDGFLVDYDDYQKLEEENKQLRLDMHTQEAFYSDRIQELEAENAELKMSEQDDWVKTALMAFVIGIIWAVIATVLVLIKDPEPQKCECVATQSEEQANPAETSPVQHCQPLALGWCFSVTST